MGSVLSEWGSVLRCSCVGEVKEAVWGVEKCGKVYGVSGEVCWRVGKGCG